MILDTSAWIAVFNEEPAADAVVAQAGEQRSVTTPIVLAELLARAELGRVRGDDVLEEVERRSRLVNVTREDAILAAQTYARLRRTGRSKVGLADALIHATALRIGATLVTLDADLRGEPGVVIVPRT